MVDVIRSHDPDLILTHYKDDMHPDHRATYRLVTDAYYMASLPLVESEYEPCDPDNIYYFGKPTSEFEPSVFVDVDGYLDQKVEAIEKHESQVEFLVDHGGIDAEFDNLIEGLRAENIVLGKQSGANSAEGYEPLHESAQAYLD
jgi:LmbE family N-acetylglucosaminyl deacetylase